ncbi:MAG: haloacid dehalogenase, partial [Pseudonocardia sp.]|nr:haloacid dehalogenase [Pseudonocardia sp.]
MTAPERTRSRRPKVVLLDVFETLLRLSALRPRFVDVGRPERDLELFFTRTLRDGMALTLAGGSPPFIEVARSALIGTTGRRLSEEAVQHVLAGLSELPPHPDVEPALMTLAKARVPAYAFTHGSAEVARQA